MLSVKQKLLKSLFILTEWYEPEKGVMAEDCAEIVVYSPVIDLFIAQNRVSLSVSFLFAEFHCCELNRYQIYVECHKQCYDEADGTGENIGRTNIERLFVIEAGWVLECPRDDRFGCYHDHPAGQ